MSTDRDKPSPSLWQKVEAAWQKFKTPLDIAKALSWVTGCIVAICAYFYCRLPQWSWYAVALWLLGWPVLAGAIILLWRRPRIQRSPYERFLEPAAHDDAKQEGEGPAPTASGPQTEGRPAEKRPTAGPKAQPIPAPKPARGQPRQRKKTRPQRPEPKPTQLSQSPQSAVIKPPERPTRIDAPIDVTVLRGPTIYDGRDFPRLTFGFRFDWQGDEVINLSVLCPHCDGVMSLSPDQEITFDPHDTVLSCRRCLFRCSVRFTPEGFRTMAVQVIYGALRGGYS